MKPRELLSLLSPFKRTNDSTVDELLWQPNLWSNPTASGMSINQQSALSASAVLACVTMLAEDIAKLPWSIFRIRPDGYIGDEAEDHYLYDLLQVPNEWQNGMEFREQMQVSLILRGNAYAVIIRDGRGFPIKFVPVNADWVALWEAPDGNLFYRVTPQGLHMRAQLMEQPFLIPFRDMLHIRGFSINGLVGVSRIALAKEAVGLGLAQEKQAARWMGNGAKPSGVLQTDSKLTPEAAARIANDWKSMFGGLQNAGKTAVLEQGLKFERLDMTSSDLEFIASRKFQLEEIARIFRIPLHMIAQLQQSTNNNIAQQAQEYVNYTLTGYANRWTTKLDSTFELRKAKLRISFDYRELTTADLTARINNWRTMVMSMIAKPDEARADLRMRPEGGEADKLYAPANMAVQGSQSSGTAPDDAGRPAAGAPAV